MSDELGSLINQRKVIQLRLQLNRRVFIEQLSEAQSSYPRSQAFKFFSEPSTQAWLTDLSKKLFGMDVPSMVSRCVWLASYVKSSLYTHSAEEERV